MADIRGKVAEGIESLDHGETVAGNEVFDQLLNGRPSDGSQTG